MPPLNKKQQKEMDDNYKKHYDELLGDKYNYITKLKELGKVGLGEIKPEPFDSVDPESLEYVSSRTDIATFKSFKNSNPNLNPELREFVNRLSDESAEELVKNNYLMISAFAYAGIANDPNVSDEVNTEATARQGELALKKEAFFNKSKATEELLIHLCSNEEEPLPDDRRNDYAQILGIPVDTIVKMDDLRGQPVQPDNLNFYADYAPVLVNNESLVQKVKSGQIPNLNFNEMAYAISTFDRNMNGLYGRPGGEKDVNPGDPMYLGKFDHIYIGDRSVSSLCEKQTMNMTEVEKSNYMKCYVTAMAIERKSDVSLVLPKKENGKPVVIPMTSKVEEKKLSGAARFFAGKTPQQKYEAEQKKKSHAQADLRGRIANGIQAQELFEAKVKAVDGLKNDSYKLGKALYGDGFKDSEEPGTGHCGIGDTDKIKGDRSGLSIGIAALFVNGHSFEDILDPDKLQKEKKAVGNEIKERIKQGKDKGNPKGVEDSEKWIADLYQSFAEKYAELPKLPIDHTDPLQISENYRDMHCRGYVAFDIGQEITRPKKIIIDKLGGIEYTRLDDSEKDKLIPEMGKDALIQKMGKEEIARLEKSEKVELIRKIGEDALIQKMGNEKFENLENLEKAELIQKMGKDALIKKLGEKEYSRHVDVLAFNSVPYKTLGDSIKGPELLEKMYKELSNQDKIMNTVISTHLRPEFGEALNKAEKIESIDGKPMTDKYMEMFNNFPQASLALNSASRNKMKTAALRDVDVLTVEKGKEKGTDKKGIVKEYETTNVKVNFGSLPETLEFKDLTKKIATARTEREEREEREKEARQWDLGDMVLLSLDDLTGGKEKKLDNTVVLMEQNNEIQKER